MMDTLWTVNLLYEIAVSFISMTLLDLIWVKYTHAMMQHRALAAGSWAMGITLCMTVMTITFVSNPWMIIPTVAGSFVGTYIATKGEAT